jgi:hypothetical protein
VIGHVALHQHVLESFKDIEEGFVLVISAHIVVIKNRLYFILLKLTLCYVFNLSANSAKVLVKLVKRLSYAHFLGLLAQLVDFVEILLSGSIQLCIEALVLYRGEFYYSDSIAYDLANSIE